MEEGAGGKVLNELNWSYYICCIGHSSNTGVHREEGVLWSKGLQALKQKSMRYLPIIFLKIKANNKHALKC